jgi:hypothetical protein
MVEILFDKDENWEARTLCSDESCIGVIGPDGKCKECGKLYAGILPAANFQTGKPAAATDENKMAVQTNSDSGADDWDTRVLCSDEACIGVIGPDGLCKECGKLGSK